MAPGYFPQPHQAAFGSLSRTLWSPPAHRRYGAGHGPHPYPQGPGGGDGPGGANHPGNCPADLPTPEAVDNYLRLFDRVLLLRYYRVPTSAMMRITGHSQSLLEEHLALVEKHFPDDEEPLVSYTGKRGIKLEKSS